jgi:heme/copper-type cytochrome/quinol oxidase subunit 1
MPPLTRLFIKTALVWFVTALGFALLLVLQYAVTMPTFVGAFGPIYFHLFMVGWVTQLIFGVAYWMFPKFNREQPRGHEGLAWVVYWLLNVGLALRLLGEPLTVLQPGAGWRYLLPVSAVFQWTAGIVFVTNTWPRVRER